MRNVSVSGHWAAFAVLGMAIAFWWSGKPYLAFTHDSLFYMGDAVMRAGWADLSRDLFFRFGSQGDFTPMISLYALLVKQLGVHASAWAVTVVGKLAWLLGGWALVSALIPSRAQACVALSAVLLLPGFYQASDIFSYGESFATPRLLAEACALAGLGCLVAGRRWVGGALVLLSALAHPLMGASVLGVAALFELGRPAGRLPWGRVALLGITAAALVVLGALCGVPPLDRLLLRYDDAWMGVITVRNDYVLVQTWGTDGFIHLLAQCAWLGLAVWRQPSGGRAHLLARALLVVLVACLAVWLCASAMANVLLVQLQLWRALWLAQWLTPVLLIASCPPSPRSWTRADWVLVLVMVVGALSQPQGSLVMAGVVFLLVRYQAVVDRHVAPGLQLAIVGVALGVTLFFKWLSLPALVAIARVTMDAPHPWLQALALEPGIGFSVALVLAALALRLPAAFQRICAAVVPVASVGVALCGLGLWLVDSWPMVHAEEPWAVALRERLPRDAVVYTDLPISTVWLDLHRAHYAETQQGASVLFYRDQALLFNQRQLRLNALGLTEWPKHGKRNTAVRLDEAHVAPLCRDAELDVVLIEGHWASASYHVPISRTRELAVFECKAWRPAERRHA